MAERLCVCNHTPGTHEFGLGTCVAEIDGGEVCPCNKFREKKDMVNHPSYYGGDTTYEVIKVLFAWGLEKYALRWNAVKYIARAHHKGAELEDLKKARFYLDREITNLEAGK